MSSLSALWDEASSDDQFELNAALKEQGTLLVLTVRDRRNLRKFSNSYNCTALSAKGLTQSMDKLQKLLNTASTTTKPNWSMQFGYHSTPNSKSSAKMDLMPSYLSRSDVDRLRKRPKNGDTLYVLLSINEDFFSVSTQFKLFEIERPKAPRPRSSSKSKARRTMSQGVSSRTLDSMQLFGAEGDEATEQKVAELMAEIKSLSRDNQVLKKKLQKMENAKGGVMKKMDTERTMRLQANKERFWLKQKLDRLQKAISARLKILGVDFSKAEDITSALDMAFNVIQKLAKELQRKEEELEESTTRMEKADKQRNALKKAKEEMDAVLEKQRGATKDLKKQIRERDRRLSLVGHQRDDTEAVLTVQLETLQTEMEQLRAENERTFNQLVDEKAALSQQRESAVRELEDVKGELVRIEQSVKTLSLEKAQIKADNECLLTSKAESDAKLQEATKETADLRMDLESVSKDHDLLKDRHKALQQQFHGLTVDISRLKTLLQRASSLELQLKSVLDDSQQAIEEMVIDEGTVPGPGSQASSQTSISSDDE